MMDSDLSHYDVVTANPAKQVVMLRHKTTGRDCYLKVTPEQEVARNQAAYAALANVDQSDLSIDVAVPELTKLQPADVPQTLLSIVEYGRPQEAGPSDRTTVILTDGLPGNPIIFASLVQDLGWLMKDRAKGNAPSLARELVNERFDYMHEAMNGVGFKQQELDDLAAVLDAMGSQGVVHNDLGNNICVFRDPETKRMHFGIIDWEKLGGVEAPEGDGGYIRRQAERMREAGLLADDAPPALPSIEFFFDDVTAPSRPLRQMEMPNAQQFMAKRGLGTTT